ncbi:arif-1 [Erannis ankeraria nucleopolyhedrovirus]|uniref:arif-1 n=1 Tax=Erannis ankeraria nucleopolyhedrovirus TaxID=2913600 RepID=UPI00117A7C24|nr:arif-1 [Erannis ankeraria nucleopolyhedrovirus]UJZ88986.1 arif-1 [Erannis ankeraria nucleopolyhedrovirus]
MIKFSVFLLSCGTIVVALGTIGLLVPSASLKIDYENGTPNVDCSALIVIYGLVLNIIALCGLYSWRFKKLKQYFFAISMLFSIWMIVLIVVLIFKIDWLIKFGHIAILDVKFRSHDNSSVCWDGIKVADSNSVTLNSCYTIQHQIFCATCRKEYYRNEATFLNSCRFIVIYLFTAVAMVQLFYLYKLFSMAINYDLLESKIKHSKVKKSPNKNERTSLSESEYSVPGNNRPVANTFWHNHQNIYNPLSTENTFSWTMDETK